jgi:hypothetical protein
VYIEHCDASNKNPWESAGVALAEHVAEAEAAIGRHAFADHHHAPALIQAAGVTPAHFEDEGWRLVFCGSVVCRDRLRVDLVRVTWRALAAAGLADDSLPADKQGPCWSLAALCRLATGTVASEWVIERDAGGLLYWRERAAAFQEHVRAAAVLAAAVGAPRRMRRTMMLPPIFHQGAA